MKVGDKVQFEGEKMISQPLHIFEGEIIQLVNDNALIELSCGEILLVKINRLTVKE